VLPVPGGGGGQSVDDASGLGVGSGKSAHGEKSACNGKKRKNKVQVRDQLLACYFFLFQKSC
jgi:hypothetical protein